jgi:acryloyl-coenzyme A reductase
VRQVSFAEPGGPEVLQYGASADLVPGPDDVIVQVAACGVCGHDTADRSGLAKVPLPCVLGHEIAGVITALGPRVSGFEIGDRVASKQFHTCGRCLACRSGRDLDCPKRRFMYGGNAEQVALPADVLLKIPGGVSDGHAAVVACAVGSPFQALADIGRVTAGETVVVVGAGGGLGVHGVQVARALGARVVALTSSPHKAEQLRALGADQVVVGGPSAASDLGEATGGRGPEVVLDTVGNPDVFSQVYRSLARHGRYVFCGQVQRWKIQVYPMFIFGKEAVITGSSSTRMASFMRAMDLVERGLVVPVTQEYALSEAAKAHADMEANQVFGRAVLRPEGQL